MVTLYYIHKGVVSGTFTSIIDLYLFLKDKFETKFVVHTDDFYHTYRVMKNNFPKIKLDNVKMGKEVVESDVVITSTDTLTKSSDKIECNRAIFLDATGLAISKYTGTEKDYFKNVPDNSILLGNKSNEWAGKYFLDFTEYYHRFSKQRLDFIESKMGEDDDVLTVEDIRRTKRTKDGFDKLPHRFRELVYNRWFAIAPDVYVENIGKLIFEFRYIGKMVRYSAKNKTFDDGLTFYLQKFGIDDNFDQDIYIPREIIEEKMVYNDNDRILEIL